MRARLRRARPSVHFTMFLGHIAVACLHGEAAGSEDHSHLAR